jgi:hypothetical protein
MTATSTTAANKRKNWDCSYYAKKKLCLLDFESAANTTTIANATVVVATSDATAIATADSAAAMAAITSGLSIIADFAKAADPWSLNTDGTVRTPAARQAPDGKESAGEAGHQCYPPRRKHQRTVSTSPCCR